MTRRRVAKAIKDATARTALADSRVQRLRMLDANGGVTPDAVVADAADPRSPLHDCFEWDDTEAARRYRLDQARALIVRYRVEIVTTERVVSAVAFLRDPRARPDEQGYVEVTQVVSDTELKRGAVVAELDRCVALLVRADDIAQACDFGSFTAPLLKHARDVRDRIAASPTAKAA